MAYINNTTCCGMREIANLSQNDTPEKALLDIMSRAYSSYSKADDYIYPFKSIMIFTGVVEINGLDSLSEEGRKTELAYASFAPDRNLTYAPKFAAFLRANKLGDVKRVCEAYNVPGHPKHLVRVYVWQPDADAIGTWWKAQVKKLGGVTKIKKLVNPTND